MTPQIALVLGILAVAIVLFVSERLRVDVVALLVLVTLALTGLVEPKQALTGFSNPAVITVWAVFILSGGLSRTGVAGIIGRQVLRLAGNSEIVLVSLIMLTSGLLSAFMNNVGVTALLLPVVMDIARRTKRPPSKLLIPLAFSSLLGGLTTLIGTSPNLLIGEVLRDAGMRPFGLFDFTPAGVTVMLAGIAYMAIIGRHMLPARDPVSQSSDLGAQYRLADQLFVIPLDEGSPLAGRPLAESRLGAVLGLNVIGIQRRGKTRLAPDPETELMEGDRLLVQGDRSALDEFRDHEYFHFETDSLPIEELVSAAIAIADVELLAPSRLVGQTLAQSDFRNRYGAIVLAIRRGSRTMRTNLETVPLEAGDHLLVQATHEVLDGLRHRPQFLVSDVAAAEAYGLEERLMVARVPANSTLAGKSLKESRLGEAFGTGVMGIMRQGTTQLMPGPDEKILAGDTLFLKCKREDLSTVEGLHDLSLETSEVPALEQLESENVGLAEVVLAPRSTLVGKTLTELHFREKYGLNVIAVTRGAEVLRENLRDLDLRFGDALLLYGSRQKIAILGAEPDFLVLTEEAQEVPRSAKAPIAAALMLAVVASVLFGFLPIYIAAVAGALLMVLTHCLTMDEAYRAIEWKAVFLIAGMLPLGMAMQDTGAAQFLTEQVVTAVGGFGPLAVAAALYIVTAASAQVMPTAAVAILIGPIALNTAQDLGVSPESLLMAVALSASASFMSPVAHPANVLIMGPGNYRFADYIKVGLPLTLVCLLTTLFILPIVWPFHP